MASSSGLLAGLLCVLACAQGLAQSVCTDTTNQRIDVRDKPRSGNGHDCNYTLFPSGSGAATVGQAGVDYCKQLIIIDPAIIANMPQLEFGPMLRHLLDADTDKTVDAWIRTWAEGDGESTRSGVETIVSDAWEKRIKPIAVINRLDLAQNPEIPRGEGRVVYQMFSESGSAMNMTLILEFDYPWLPGMVDATANTRAWARIWQELAVPTSAAQFRCALDGVIRGFAQRDNLRRIRTNEALVAGQWAFREFEFRGCGRNASPGCVPTLAWVELPHTPRDGYRNERTVGSTRAGGVDAVTLQQYLQHPAVLAALRAGKHRFGTNYGHDPAITIELDRSAETATDGTWIGLRGSADEASLLMSFNSCNGCHTDFKESRDTLPHIRVPLGGERPVLSSFLRSSISDLGHPLPGCASASGTSAPVVLGCRGRTDAGYVWDERLHRVLYMEYLLNEKEQKALLPATPLQYRYH